MLYKTYAKNEPGNNSYSINHFHALSRRNDTHIEYLSVSGIFKFACTYIKIHTNVNTTSHTIKIKHVTTSSNSRGMLIFSLNQLCRCVLC